MSSQIGFPLLILVIIFALSFVIHESSSQPSSITNPVITDQQTVTYQKQSNYIHEFDVPNLKEKGLKGIVTDSDGNPWFYHQTNKTSTLIRFNPLNDTFSSYPIEGTTITDNSIINLAGGQLIYDEKRKGIWFTDARLNALGSIDTQNGKIEVHKIPTKNSGVMGLVLSPDGNSIWFTEIIGNNIGSFDINSKTIKEYPTGEFTGPTLLAYDSNGQLWVTMSYSNSILKVEPWSLIPGSKISGIFEIKLEKPDSLSPFGIAIADKNKSKLYISDHGSSRLVVSNLTSELKNYTSYWTSPSQALPMSLPSQVVSDKSGNIFFAEHGGNKIGKVSSNTGIMTEFEIPTGPLATSLFLTVSNDEKRIWFTEWASNKIGYLDNTLQVPINIAITKNESASSHTDISPIILKGGESFAMNVKLTLDKKKSSLVMANDTEISVVGMTDSGLQGLQYRSDVQSANLMKVPKQGVRIDLKVETERAIAGNYWLMIKASLLEKDHLIISLLYPQLVKLDVPTKPSDNDKIQNFQQVTSKNAETANSSVAHITDLLRYSAIAVAMALVAYLIYHKFRRR